MSAFRELSADEDTGSKRRRVELERSKDSKGLGGLHLLNTECLMSILGFLTFSDLNVLSICSKACLHTRNDPRLDQTREGQLNFSRSSTPSLVSTIRTLAFLQMGGMFGRMRSHLKIQYVGLCNMKVVPMRDVQRILFGRDSLFEPLRYVTSLDVSNPSPHLKAGGRLSMVKITVFKSLALMLPNLVSLDMSRANVTFAALTFFSKKCPYLETITCNNATTSLSISGNEIRYALNLREISIENSELYLSLSESASNSLLLGRCSKETLATVNVKGTTYKNSIRGVLQPLSQTMLIDFVLATPSLVRFTSDCTPETIQTLKALRPKLVFR